MGARLRVVGSVRLRVDPELLHEALATLTALESPLAIRVAIDGDLLALTVHSPEEGWWSTVAVAGRGMRPRPRRAVAVTVGLLQFVELVEYCRLSTSPNADMIVAIRDSRSLSASRWTMRALSRTTAIELPPSLDEWDCIQRDAVIPSVGTRDGEVDFELHNGRCTARAALLERMTRRGIHHGDLFEHDGEVFLLGASSERSQHGEPLNVVLVGPARISYDPPVPGPPHATD